MTHLVTGLMKIIILNFVSWFCCITWWLVKIDLMRAGGARGGSGRIKRRVKEETNGSGKVEERVRNKETDTDFETDSLLKLTALCGGGE